MNTLKNTAGKAEQAPVDAPLAANLDEAGLAALQAAIAERKARNKDRTRIILGMFAAAAITIAVWNIVALAILFPVLVGALIVAGRLWAGWTGDDEDSHVSMLDPRHIGFLCMSDADAASSPWPQFKGQSWDD